MQITFLGLEMFFLDISGFQWLLNTTSSEYGKISARVENDVAIQVCVSFVFFGFMAHIKQNDPNQISKQANGLVFKPTNAGTG